MLHIAKVYTGATGPDAMAYILEHRCCSIYGNSLLNSRIVL